jgi:gas vesicle protein
MKRLAVWLLIFFGFCVLFWDKRELADSITDLVKKHGDQVEEKIKEKNENYKKRYRIR